MILYVVESCYHDESKIWGVWHSLEQLTLNLERAVAEGWMAKFEHHGFTVHRFPVDTVFVGDSYYAEIDFDPSDCKVKLINVVEDAK